MVHPEHHRKRNVWFLEMGPRESKIKPMSRAPMRPDHGSGIVTSSQNNPKKPVQSTNPESVPVWPDNSVRWQSLHDVYICHSREEVDCSYAMEMLSYLEQQPEKLRCFLPMRDMLVGSPIPSEMCSGLENSHCWVMLLTSHFLSDSWCKYQMHQFLSQAPCSNGRLIPIVIGLPLAQYPPEIKHMYAFKSAIGDKSVFTKVKGAIVTYLKEMITVTSDQIPAHSQNSSTLASSQSARETIGNSQVESSATQKSTHDRSIGISVSQETTSDMSSRSPVTQETTSDMSSQNSVTQENTTEVSLRSSMTEEPTSGMFIRKSVSGQTTSNMSSKRPVTQETTGDISSRSSLTQENTTEVSLRSSMTEEPTSGMFIRKSVSGQTTSNMSSKRPVTQETTGDISSRSSLTQENTTEVSLRSSVSEETTSGMFIRNSVTGQETTSDILTKSSTIELKTRLMTTSDMPMRSSVTPQKTASNMSKSSSLSRPETRYSLQDKYSDLSLSPPLINTKEVCTDCKCILTATKDSLSQENRVDTNDSGVWSMTKDLLTDCSDLRPI